MAYGAFAETKSRYRDLEALVDYREYEGEWTAWFEENWLKPRLKALGLHARPVLRWKDVRVRRELSGTCLRVGKTRWRPRGVLCVRVTDAVPQRSDDVEQRSVEIIRANQVKENSRCT